MAEGKPQPSDPKHPDDFPAEFWLRVRVLPSPSGIPAAIRVRHMLKQMLRSYHLRVEAMPDTLPEDEHP
jgi:hypothetical protein